MAVASTTAWGSDGRFEIVQLLGGGGMGVVYEAVDRQRPGRVALKTLVDATAFGIAQFKSEFRALSDLCHPNLVSLYELFDDQGRWFFTMEYVPGSDFLQYVRATGGPAVGVRSVDETKPVETGSGAWSDSTSTVGGVSWRQPVDSTQGDVFQRGIIVSRRIG
jgi:Protein kinase domain